MLHKGYNESQIIESSEGQRELLCSNIGSFRCPSLELRPVLSGVTIEALEKLGDILKNIHVRMIQEGYEITGGIIQKRISQNHHEQNKF